MQILITGAAGFVGTNLTKYLRGQGHEVITTDIKGAEIEGDITDPGFTLVTLRGYSFDAIIHLAAIANIKFTIENPLETFRVNVLGTVNTLELAARNNVQRFVYQSSCNVYGVPKKVPVDEDVPWNPRSPYDYSKCASELAVQSYVKTRNVKAVILRSWKLFGPHDVATTAVSRFITSALRNEPIPLYNGGRDIQDFNYIENYCDAVGLLLRSEDCVGKVFNIGYGKEVSVREVAETIIRLTGSKSEIMVMPPRTPLEAEPMRGYPSIERARTVLGYEPRIKFEEGLLRTISWMKSKMLL